MMLQTRGVAWNLEQCILVKRNHRHCWKLWYNIATSPELHGLMDKLSVEAGWKVGGRKG
jgi:uncharacterized protein YerC